MFTGIIETIGEIRGIERRGEGARLEIETGDFAAGVREGDSVSVSGVCLTASRVAGGSIAFDANRETLEKTTLGGARPGARVNLERALQAGGRIGGHFVQGHVDATGRIRSLRRTPGDTRLEVAWDPALLLFLVDKGSVAVEGVSLTVIEVKRDAFTATLIPETLERTTLGGLAAGDAVNVEADVLGKIVVRYLERRGDAGGGLTMESLGEAGFL